jgi:hypothetical protein
MAADHKKYGDCNVLLPFALVADSGVCGGADEAGCVCAGAAGCDCVAGACGDGG